MVETYPLLCRNLWVKAWVLAARAKLRAYDSGGRVRQHRSPRGSPLEGLFPLWSLAVGHRISALGQTGRKFDVRAESAFPHNNGHRRLRPRPQARSVEAVGVDVIQSKLEARIMRHQTLPAPNSRPSAVGYAFYEFTP
jgi:hypothetical protein